MILYEEDEDFSDVVHMHSLEWYVLCIGPIIPGECITKNVGEVTCIDCKMVLRRTSSDE